MAVTVTTLTVISWFVCVSAALLMGVKVWHWVDVNEDWRAAKMVDPESAIYQQARGAMRLAWLRLTDGVCWLLLSMLMLNADLPVFSDDMGYRALSRVVILLMVWLEMAKLGTDRLTRQQIWDAIDSERQRVRSHGHVR